MAPAFYAGIADFNGDGKEDVFLSQNFFPTDVATPRYDAGRSLLLLRRRTRAASSPCPGSDPASWSTATSVARRTRTSMPTVVSISQ